MDRSRQYVGPLGWKLRGDAPDWCPIYPLFAARKQEHPTHGAALSIHLTLRQAAWKSLGLFLTSLAIEADGRVVEADLEPNPLPVAQATFDTANQKLLVLLEVVVFGAHLVLPTCVLAAPCRPEGDAASMLWVTMRLRQRRPPTMSSVYQTLRHLSRELEDFLPLSESLCALSGPVGPETRERASWAILTSLIATCVLLRLAVAGQAMAQGVTPRKRPDTTTTIHYLSAPRARNFRLFFHPAYS